MEPNETTIPRIRHRTAGEAGLALVVLLSPDLEAIGQIHALERDLLTLGRAGAEGGLGFRDPRLSRRHAAIRWDPARVAYLLEDVGSRNGTRLNGRSVSREVLEVGDVVRLGDTVILMDTLDLRAAGWRVPEGSELHGASAAMSRVHQEIRHVAPTDMSVLILGETGTGKELVAREIHRMSGRQGPFIAVNCAAIPTDLLESELFGHVRGAFSGADRSKSGLLVSAEGGTLFLDEVGELQSSHQAKLLRALDERAVRPVGASRTVPVDVRFLAATHRDLHHSTGEGGFRTDLLARLDQWSIEIAPLRERHADLLPILRQVVARHGGGHAYSVTADYFEPLALYDWPLNVRELISIVRRSLVLVPDGGVLSRTHLSHRLRPSRSADVGATPASPGPELPPAGEVPTRAELVALLEHYGGSVAAVARHIDRARQQVYRWIERHGLNAADFRR